MRADLYARPRQKGMRLLFRAPVVKVETIAIREALIGHILKDGSMTEPLPRKVIEIEGVQLSSDECDGLAWRDGFRHLFNGHPSEALGTGGCFEMMMYFWRGRLPFHGQIIHWDYANRFMEIPKVQPLDVARRFVKMLEVTRAIAKEVRF